MDTLPDLLAPDVRVVFVGINPSSYSVARGHYFARKQNRFWPAFSQSRLSARVRASLGVDRLEPHHDVRLPEFGFGFTDVVKRPSPNCSSLTPAEYQASAPALRERLSRYQPRLICFHGLTAFRPFARHGLGHRDSIDHLGLQPLTLGGTPLYVLPNPSPANAHFTLQDQIGWYDRIADWLGGP
jgi:TDG/mug DNA glycosylase family protein